MPGRKSYSQEAWDRFQADMKSLGDQLRKQYESGAADRVDLKAALNKLGQAADEVFDSLGKAAKDSGMRENTEKAARSFGAALAETFRDLADELADAVKSRKPGR
jgi:ElaB/YqjD/DUF883 family membrane-anchored ribosome-binding protein